MANTQLVIKNIEKIDEYIADVYQSIKDTTIHLKRILNERPDEVLYEMKFGKIGKNPLLGEPLNLIEQLNQVYTYLVTLHGAKILMKNYANHVPYRLNLGTTGGHDIESIDGEIICECFSITSLRSNDKINKDAKRLVNNEEASRRFIFYHTPGEDVIEYYAEKYPSIKFVKIELSRGGFIDATTTSNRLDRLF